MSKQTTIRIWISNQPEGCMSDTTADYIADVARRSELMDGISVTEDSERGVLLTGPASDIDLLGNQLDALLRHDPYGDDTRSVEFTWDAVEEESAA